MSKTYDFGEGFEQRVLRLCMLDPTFVPLHGNLLSPTYFTKEPAQALVHALNTFWSTYHCPPTYESFSVFLKADAREEPPTLAYLDRCMALNGQDANYIKAKVVEFAQERAVEAALLESARLVTEARYNEIRQCMAKALSVGQGGRNGAIDYFGSTVDRFRGYRDDQGAEVIPTGLVTLDHHLDGGGLGRGELGLVQAPPGYGKTALLVNLGYGSLLQGRRVAHFTFEVSANKVARRYDMRITGMSKDDLRKRLRTGARHILKLAEDLQCGLRIKQFPNRGANCGDIGSALDWLAETDNFRPDLIIVDYGEIMAPETPRDDRWIEIGETYEALRGMAVERHAALWSGSQTKASALSVKTSDMSHTGGAHAKNMVADLLITINAEPSARDTVMLRLHIAKNREGKSGVEIPVTFTQSTHTIVPAED